MMGTHFFPRSYLLKKSVPIGQRRLSLGNHYVVSNSLQKSQQKSINNKIRQHSNPKMPYQLESKHFSIGTRIQSHQQWHQPLFHKFYVDKRTKQNHRGGKTLVVKGFRQKVFSDLAFEMSQQNDTSYRKTISANCSQNIRRKRLRNQTMVVQTPIIVPSQVRLKRLRSKDTSTFRGWEISLDEFTDF